MKKSKLFVALLAMLLALSCVLVACVGDEPEPTKYTVTFNLNGAPGNAPAAQTIEQGKTATAPTDPSWDDKHTFGGWCTDAAGNNAWSFTTAVTKDITLYAKWTEEDPGQITPTPVTYTVTFNLNGAPGTAPQAQKIVEGETATQPPVPTWDDEHEFGGWFTEAACTNEWSFTTAVTADTTLYAKWTEVEDLTPVVVTYTVTFNLNGAEGTTPETQTINEGETATEPTEPAWDGYTFDGWFTDAECTTEWNFGSVVTSDLTLYAKWTEIKQYTITLHANGGLFEEEEDTAETDTATYTVVNVDEFNQYEDLPAPKRTGYIFVGWYTTKEAADELDSEWDGVVSDDIELWAGWEAAEFDIEFNANFGTFPIGATKYITAKYAGETLSEQEIASITEPTKYGYEFAGWYTDVEGTTTWDFSATLTGEEIFYAKWTKRPPVEYEKWIGENEQFDVINYDMAGEYVGIIDGEEVTIKVIAFEFNDDGVLESYGKIELEGHVVNIKSKAGVLFIDLTVEIDGVEVILSFLPYGDGMSLVREGYELIEFERMM